MAGGGLQVTQSGVGHKDILWFWLPVLSRQHVYKFFIHEIFKNR